MTAIQVLNDLTVYVRHDPYPAEYVGELWQFTGREPDQASTLPDQIELRGSNGVMAVYTLVTL